MPSLFNAILFMFLNLYHNALLLLLLVLFSSKAFSMSYQIYLSQKQLFFFLQLSCLKCFCGCSLYLIRWSVSSLLCYRNSLFYISNLTYHKLTAWLVMFQSHQQNIHPWIIPKHPATHPQTRPNAPLNNFYLAVKHCWSLYVFILISFYKTNKQTNKQTHTHTFIEHLLCTTHYVRHSWIYR